MKKHASQDGSAHVVLIVILILAILGLLGYVAYGAFTKQKQAASTQPVSSSQQPSATASTRELTFDNWNVAMTVPKSSTLYVKTSSDAGSFDGYYAYDTAFDQACSDTSDRSIGALTRVNADDQVDPYLSDQPMTNREFFTKNPSGAVVLGDYAYYYTKPNGAYACTDPSSSNAKAASDAMGNARTTFTSALSGLHATTR